MGFELKFENLELFSKMAMKYPDAATKKMREAGVYAKNKLRAATPVGAYGHLKRGWFQASVSPVTVILENRMSYGHYPDEGTAPHMPPLDPLLIWVRRKFGMSGKEAYAAAKGVQRKISRKGLNAQKFVEKTLSTNEQQIYKILVSLLGSI